MVTRDSVTRLAPSGPQWCSGRGGSECLCFLPENWPAFIPPGRHTLTLSLAAEHNADNRPAAPPPPPPPSGTRAYRKVLESRVSGVRLKGSEAGTL